MQNDFVDARYSATFFFVARTGVLYGLNNLERNHLLLSASVSVMSENIVSPMIRPVAIMKKNTRSFINFILFMLILFALFDMLMVIIPAVVDVPIASALLAILPKSNKRSEKNYL